jgi:hypothetical protein
VEKIEEQIIVPQQNMLFELDNYCRFIEKEIWNTNRQIKWYRRYVNGYQLGKNKYPIFIVAGIGSFLYEKDDGSTGMMFVILDAKGKYHQMIDIIRNSKFIFLDTKDEMIKYFINKNHRWLKLVTLRMFFNSLNLKTKREMLYELYFMYIAKNILDIPKNLVDYYGIND